MINKLNLRKYDKQEEWTISNVVIKELNSYEKAFLRVLGDLYERRGQNRKQGEIWAILRLKNECGLDQQELSYHLKCNISTISRQLKPLLNSHLVNFKDNSDNQQESIGYVRRRYYSRRIYFVEKDFRDIIATSLTSIIENSKGFKEKLELLKNKIEKDFIKNEYVKKNILIHIDDIDARVKILNEIFNKFISESKEILQNVN